MNYVVKARARLDLKSRFCCPPWNLKDGSLAAGVPDRENFIRKVEYWPKNRVGAKKNLFF
jgi:hypothetical protein